MLHRLVHFAKAQRHQIGFLALAFVNWTLDQRDFYFAHGCINR